ncbi:general transcription factor II-I repeat domain-containing protein 2-like [Xiphophorus hellerii]|uniref:general transcription factor II-I repeat domain-containing protein 2-like n=2 Tax=Xiphophorus hellerii TaxID=8084 RepID=UPI0013B3A67C|nr:general transcription factor II-I repeat domain-containing protein 2-like [Xiphophorus hellerii]
MHADRRLTFFVKMAKCKAKRKYDDEHRTFLEEWEDAYFFIERNGKSLCLLCDTTISHYKASNLQRHFSTLHANIDKDFPKGTELRKQKLSTLKSQVKRQSQMFQQLTKRGEAVTLASYKVAWNIARAKKPYNEGEFLKQCFVDLIDILAPDNKQLKDSITDLQMSRHTVETRISDINNALESDLHADLNACAYFSVALDESCDIQDKPQLAIFVRMISEDCVVKEELLDIVPLKDRTRGTDVKEAMMEVFKTANMSLEKLTAIATDGAPSMIGSVNGLVGLCKGDDLFPDFWNFHCIIHREQLVSKTLNLDHVMKPMMEIVNYIRTHALTHRQFKNLIADLDGDLPGDLPLHCAVRWLSRGKVVSRFLELLEPVKLFMAEKNKSYPQLSDPKWLMDLAFLVDMLSHLDKLNLDLQGKLKTLPDLTQSVFSFVNKVKLFKVHIQNGNLSHFPSLRSAQQKAGIRMNMGQYVKMLAQLYGSITSRFEDLQQKRPQIALLIDPFNAEADCLKSPLVTDEAASELEMIELREDDRLKSLLKEGPVAFWRVVPTEKYPCVKRAALKLLSMFSSTYVCESLFSTLKHVKSKHRSVLTDTHVKELLRVATTEYQPDLQRITRNKRCQKSH